MKRLIVIGIASLAALSMMSETHMELRPKDLSAKVNARLDLNGRECALLKVHIDRSDVQLRGNIVGDIGGDDEVRLVYVTEGTKSLGYVVDDSLTVITFERIGVATVKGGHTYSLTITTETPTD